MPGLKSHNIADMQVSFLVQWRMKVLQCTCERLRWSDVGVQRERRRLAVCRTVRVNGSSELVSWKHRKEDQSSAPAQERLETGDAATNVSLGTVFHGRGLPRQASWGAGTLCEGQLWQRGLVLAVISPAAFWGGHVLGHLETETDLSFYYTFLDALKEIDLCILNSIYKIFKQLIVTFFLLL